MRRLVRFWIIGMLAILWGCSSPKMANRYPITNINQDLSHWIAIDSASVSHIRSRNTDSKIGDYNLKRLRDNLDKEKDNPFITCCKICLKSNSLSHNYIYSLGQLSRKEYCFVNLICYIHSPSVNTIAAL